MIWTSLEQESPHCYSHVLLTNGKYIWEEQCFEDHGGWSEEEYPTHFMYINTIALPDGSTIKKNPCVKGDECHCDSKGCSYLPVEIDHKPRICSEQFNCKNPIDIIQVHNFHVQNRMCREHWIFKTISPFQIRNIYIESFKVKELIEYFKDML